MMSKEENEAFEILPLVYHSPILTNTATPPEHYYNPFPEFNDKAEDGSLSVFPHRAKYSLTLGSMVLPYGNMITFDEINEDFARSFPNLKHGGLYAMGLEEIGAIAPKGTMVNIPTKPEDFDIWQLHTVFELIHHRLLATPFKSSFRINLLAPFYTTLSRTLSLNRKIYVPLRPDNNSRMRLQRQWAEIKQNFKSTILIDEIYSLLATVSLYKGIKNMSEQEQIWIKQHEEEIRGFSQHYLNLRSYIKECIKINNINYPEDIELETMDFENPDDIERLNSKIIRAINILELILAVSKEETYKRTLERTKLFKNNTPKNVAEIVQTAIATAAIEEEKIRVSNPYLGVPTFLGLVFRSDNTTTYLTIMPFGLLSTIIGKSSDTQLDDKTIASWTLNTFFVEAMRQQICTGVGLRCPFWRCSAAWNTPNHTYSDCCMDFRPLLQHIYKITIPNKPEWKKHWQKPPCLE